MFPVSLMGPPRTPDQVKPKSEPVRPPAAHEPLALGSDGVVLSGPAGKLLGGAAKPVSAAYNAARVAEDLPTQEALKGARPVLNGAAAVIQFSQDDYMGAAANSLTGVGRAMDLSGHPTVQAYGRWIELGGKLLALGEQGHETVTKGDRSREEKARDAYGIAVAATSLADTGAKFAASGKVAAAAAKGAVVLHVVGTAFSIKDAVDAQQALKVAAPEDQADRQSDRNWAVASAGLSAVSSAAAIRTMKNPRSAKVMVPVAILAGVLSAASDLMANAALRRKVAEKLS